jgi:hypothetical protein
LVKSFAKNQNGPVLGGETIQEALGRQPERPAALVVIENLPQRCEVMDADLAKLKAFITANISQQYLTTCLNLIARISARVSS